MATKNSKSKIATFNFNAGRVERKAGAGKPRNNHDNIPLRSPGDDYFWCLPESFAPWFYETSILVVKEEQDTKRYFVAPEVRNELEADGFLPPKLRPREMGLFPCLNTRGDIFCWAANAPKQGVDWTDNPDSYPGSVYTVTEAARSRAVFANWNAGEGKYETWDPPSDSPIAARTADWPDLDLEEIITRALRRRIVDSIDHPAVRQLQGYE